MWYWVRSVGAWCFVGFGGGWKRYCADFFAKNLLEIQHWSSLVSLQCRTPVVAATHRPGRASHSAMKNSLLKDEPGGTLYNVKVIYSYSAESEDEVSIFEGDTIRVLQVCHLL